MRLCCSASLSVVLVTTNNTNSSCVGCRGAAEQGSACQMSWGRIAGKGGDGQKTENGALVRGGHAAAPARPSAPVHNSEAGDGPGACTVQGKNGASQRFRGGAGGASSGVLGLSNDVARCRQEAGVGRAGAVSPRPPARRSLLKRANAGGGVGLCGRSRGLLCRSNAPGGCRRLRASRQHRVLLRAYSPSPSRLQQQARAKRRRRYLAMPCLRRQKDTPLPCADGAEARAQDRPRSPTHAHDTHSACSGLTRAPSPLLTKERRDDHHWLLVLNRLALAHHKLNHLARLRQRQERAGRGGAGRGEVQAGQGELGVWATGCVDGCGGAAARRACGLSSGQWVPSCSMKASVWPFLTCGVREQSGARAGEHERRVCGTGAGNAGRPRSAQLTRQQPLCS